MLRGDGAQAGEREREREVLVLDGGFGHELKARLGAPPGGDGDVAVSFLVGALACRDRPSAVVGLHAAFLGAGCRALTTNNFVVTPHLLGKAGLGEAEAEAAVEELTRCAVACCHEARAGAARTAETSGRGERPPLLVVGSLPPAGATYRAAPAGAARAFYGKLVDIFSSSPGVDVLLGETLASAEEALACLEAASQAPERPLWISFTVRDLAPGCAPKLRGGQALACAMASLLEADRPRRQLAAVLVNCCAPASAGHALTCLSRQLQEAGEAFMGVALGAYANGFAATTSQWLGDGEGGEGEGGDRLLRQPAEDFDPETGVILPERLCDHVQGWLEDPRVSIVGGCCGVGVDHMRRVCERVRSLQPAARAEGPQ